MNGSGQAGRESPRARRAPQDAACGDALTPQTEQQTPPVGESAPREPRTREPLAWDPQSDSWLVSNARRGDPDAWEVLIRRHRIRIYRIALRMVGNPHDAEDVVQDVVVQLFTGIAGFTGASSFTTWLYRIVINRSLNHQQRRRSTRALQDADLPPTVGPEQAVIARGQVDATADALANLPPPLRTALVLHEMEGLTYEEVAAVLDVPEPTVRGRIYRARRRLLDDLQEWS